MKKNLLLSFIISLFSFVAFILFVAESYFLFEKVNNFIFLSIAFTMLLVFSILISLIIKKIFPNKKFYREIAISFLIIMISLLLINLIEMALIKFGNGNSFYFIASILQTLRVTFEFSIPIYFLVNILEVVRSKIFKDNHEKVGC